MLHFFLVFIFAVGDAPKVYVAEYPDMASCRVVSASISDHLAINSGMKDGCSAYRDKADERGIEE